MTPADEEGFLELIGRISRQTGLSLDGYKDKCLRRRIAVRMRACGVKSYQEYQELLERDAAEAARLKDTITINVTSFYRNAETWNLVRNRVLPELLGRDLSMIRAWSAGCSSGEEAYTLAMMIAEFLDQQGRGQHLDRVTVDATDVDAQCLARANQARYPREALADVPASLAQRYFEERGAEYQVIDRVRRRVVVRASDLCIDPVPRRSYQLILCRNVVIYFGRAMQERVFLDFAEALAPGGFLILGKVESLSGQARDLLTLLDARERIYRRAA
jgi:chemotaxis methyl-accepting protein methylase